MPDLWRQIEKADLEQIIEGAGEDPARRATLEEAFYIDDLWLAESGVNQPSDT